MNIHILNIGLHIDIGCIFHSTAPSYPKPSNPDDDVFKLHLEFFNCFSCEQYKAGWHLFVLSWMCWRQCKFSEIKLVCIHLEDSWQKAPQNYYKILTCPATASALVRSRSNGEWHQKDQKALTSRFGYAPIPQRYIYPDKKSLDWRLCQKQNLRLTSWDSFMTNV